MAWVPKLLSQVLGIGGSIVGLRGGTEEPHYTVEQKIDGVEIRRYGSRIAAETTVAASENAARNAGFRRLGGYIFGANHDKTKIAMTAPVSQESVGTIGAKIAMTAPVSQLVGPDDTSVIRFFMPAKWTLDTLPEPDDQAVRLVTVPAETVAVLRFTGSRSPAAVASRKKDLLKTLQDTAFQPHGAPVAWFYDPPWTVPFCRRNEVVATVKAPDHDES